MALDNLRAFIGAIDAAGDLRRVSRAVSTRLEITEIADRVMKSPGGGPALLFECPTLEAGRASDIPVAVNLFGSGSRMALALGVQRVDGFFDTLRKTLADLGDGRAAAGARVGELRVEHLGIRHERRVDGYSNNVLTGRNRRLTVPSIQQEVLASELPHVHIGPSFTDALIAWNARGAATQEVPRVVIGSRIRAVLLDVDHAEAALCRLPYKPSYRVDELIQRVMPEVIVMVTRRELIKSIVVPDVFIRVPKGEVRVADVRRRYRESHKRVLARCYVILLNAAKSCGEILDADDPVLSQRSLINDEVRFGCRQSTQVARRR